MARQPSRGSFRYRGDSLTLSFRQVYWLGRPAPSPEQEEAEALERHLQMRQEFLRAAQAEGLELTIGDVVAWYDTIRGSRLWHVRCRITAPAEHPWPIRWPEATEDQWAIDGRLRKALRKDGYREARPW